LSILLSPCHLTSIPLIIGFIDEQGRISTKRAFIISLLFSVGILITIGTIGLITGLMGRMLGDIGNIGNYIIAVIFFVIGLHLLELIPLPFVGMANQPKFKRKVHLQLSLSVCFLELLSVRALLLIWLQCWVSYSAYHPPISYMALF